MDPELRGNTFNETAGDEYAISFKRLLSIVRKRLWLVVLVALVLLGTSVGLSLLQTPVYEASLKVLVGRDQDPDSPAPLSSEVEGLQQLTLTAVEAIESRRVAETTIEELDLRVAPETFLEKLDVRQIPETQFVQIDYRDPDSERAQEIANAVGNVAAAQISDVSPGAGITAEVWELAETPEVPVSPEPIQNALLALLLGLMLGVGLAFLLEYLDDSWRSLEELEQISGVPTFGVIPKFEPSKARRKLRKKGEH